MIFNYHKVVQIYILLGIPILINEVYFAAHSAEMISKGGWPIIYGFGFRTTILELYLLLSLPLWLIIHASGGFRNCYSLRLRNQYLAVFAFISISLVSIVLSAVAGELTEPRFFRKFLFLLCTIVISTQFWWDVYVLRKKLVASLKLLGLGVAGLHLGHEFTKSGWLMGEYEKFFPLVDQWPSLYLSVIAFGLIAFDKFNGRIILRVVLTAVLASAIFANLTNKPIILAFLVTLIAGVLSGLGEKNYRLKTTRAKRYGSGFVLLLCTLLLGVYFFDRDVYLERYLKTTPTAAINATEGEGLINTVIPASAGSTKSVDSGRFSLWRLYISENSVPPISINFFAAPPPSVFYQYGLNKTIPPHNILVELYYRLGLLAVSAYTLIIFFILRKVRPSFGRAASGEIREALAFRKFLIPVLLGVLSVEFVGGGIGLYAANTLVSAWLLALVNGANGFVESRFRKKKAFGPASS